MHKFNVMFQVFDEYGKVDFKVITVEAGNKKIAALRGMQELNKIEGYSDRYKNLVKIEEVV